MNSGSSNPNFKGRNFDSDGYRLYIPHGGYDETGKTIKLHKKVVQDLFGVGSMPSGIHIHHRDCDILNNTPKNLQVMTPSDHKWLHKQFGVATLAAIERGELDYQTAAKWSDDQLRAEALLALDARDQSILYGAIMRFTGKAPDIGVLAAIKPVRVTFTEVEELTQTARGSGGFGSTGQ